MGLSSDPRPNGPRILQNHNILDWEEQMPIYKLHYEQFMLTDNEVTEICNCITRVSGASYVVEAAL